MLWFNQAWVFAGYIRRSPTSGSIDNDEMAEIYNDDTQDMIDEDDLDDSKVADNINEGGDKETFNPRLQSAISEEAPR